MSLKSWARVLGLPSAPEISTERLAANDVWSMVELYVGEEQKLYVGMQSFCTSRWVWVGGGASPHPVAVIFRLAGAVLRVTRWVCVCVCV